MSNNNIYLPVQNTQVNTNTAIDPIPTISEPNPLNYTIQGTIYGLIFFFMYFLGKPLIESFTNIFSTQAKDKKEKELKAIEAQIAMQTSIDKQQEFLQKIIQQQQQSTNTQNVQLGETVESLNNELKKINGILENRNGWIKDFVESVVEDLKANDINVKIVNFKEFKNDEK